MVGIRMSIRTTSGVLAHHQLDRLSPIRCLPHHCQVVGGVHEDAKPTSYQGLVVGHHHPDHGAPVESGRCTATR